MRCDLFVFSVIELAAAEANPQFRIVNRWASGSRLSIENSKRALFQESGRQCRFVVVPDTSDWKGLRSALCLFLAPKNRLTQGLWVISGISWLTFAKPYLYNLVQAV